MVVNFAGFKDMVNAVHGVTVCVPNEVNDNIGHIHLPQGTYKVNGNQALDYVRVRHGLGAPNGDIGRMKRQQAFISAMIAKVYSAGTLTNPVRLYNFLNAATSSLSTDSGFAHLKELASLGSSLKNIGLDKIKFVTVPNLPWPQDPNRLIFAPDAKDLWQRIKYDRPLGKFAADAVSPGNDQPGKQPGASASARRPAPRRAPRPAPTSRRRRQPARRPHARPGSAREPWLTPRSRSPRSRSGGERRRRLAEVFGEVLPEQTSDDRDPSGDEHAEGHEEWLRRQVPPHHG